MTPRAAGAPSTDIAPSARSWSRATLARTSARKPPRGRPVGAAARRTARASAIARATLRSAQGRRSVGPPPGGRPSPEGGAPGRRGAASRAVDDAAGTVAARQRVAPRRPARGRGSPRPPTRGVGVRVVRAEGRIAAARTSGEGSAMAADVRSGGADRAARSAGPAARSARPPASSWRGPPPRVRRSGRAAAWRLAPPPTRPDAGPVVERPGERVERLVAGAVGEQRGRHLAGPRLRVGRAPSTRFAARRRRPRGRRARVRPRGAAPPAAPERGRRLSHRRRIAPRRPGDRRRGHAEPEDLVGREEPRGGEQQDAREGRPDLTRDAVLECDDLRPAVGRHQL